MRPVDAPKTVWVSAVQAARWIGIGRKLFVQLAAREDWMRPRNFGTGGRAVLKWHWMDIVTFSWIYLRREGHEPTA